MHIEVKIAALLIDSATEQPVLLLQELHGERAMPIVIGLSEAGAIAAQLEEISFPRPMTHDLMNTLLLALGGSVKRVVVSELRDNTFFATIELEREGVSMSIDARPSDAIALALRCGASILVEWDVFEQSAPRPEGPAEDVAHPPIMTVPAGLGADELRRYLETLDAKQFGKYKV